MQMSDLCLSLSLFCKVVCASADLLRGMLKGLYRIFISLAFCRLAALSLSLFFVLLALQYILFVGFSAWTHLLLATLSSSLARLSARIIHLNIHFQLAFFFLQVNIRRARIFLPSERAFANSREQLILTTGRAAAERLRWSLVYDEFAREPSWSTTHNEKTAAAARGGGGCNILLIRSRCSMSKCLELLLIELYFYQKSSKPAAAREQLRLTRKLKCYSTL